MSHKWFPTFIDFPGASTKGCRRLPEAKESGEGDVVGLLQKAMYGLRDAPQVWQEEVRRILGGLGFKESITAPCVYFNEKSGLRLVTHVDDFLCIGPGEELRSFY